MKMTRQASIVTDLFLKKKKKKNLYSLNVAQQCCERMNSQSSHTCDKVLRSPLPPAKLADISHYLRSDIELIERDFEICFNCSIEAEVGIRTLQALYHTALRCLHPRPCQYLLLLPN